MRVRASDRGARSYSDVPLPSISRSVFDRSHSVHTAFNAGDLIPVDREELLPGDTVVIQPTMFARLTTMEVPIFSNVYMDVHYFVVPMRQIWDNAEEFYGAEPGGPGTRIDRVTPKLDLTVATGAAILQETLHDYIGIPPGPRPATVAECPHNLYGRSYLAVFNEWYRDAEIEAPIAIDTGDGPDTVTDYAIQKRNKQRDRFTSARPWPYKGPAVSVPLGSSAPVISDSTTPTFIQTGQTNPENFQSSGAQGFQAGTAWDSGSATDLLFVNSGLQADLTNAVGATVNDVRNSIATQHLFEMFARGSSARYTELLTTAFQVHSPDQRLQRPEFIGGATAKLYTNPVANTTDLTKDIGYLGAYGVAVGSGRPFSYSATEHCIVLGIASIRTEMLYSEGLDKDLSRDTRFDYFWPAFQALGEQVIENQEVFWAGSGGSDDGVFGYEPRYQEYRERFNMVTGKMRPQATGTLANFHLGQLFSAQQNLNKTFIQENPPMDRVTTIAAAVEPSFKVDLFVKQRHVRPISAQGMPGLRRL